MKNFIKRFTSFVFTVVIVLSLNVLPTNAAIKPITGNSNYKTTFTVTTQAKWNEALKQYPATITFTQTKGTQTFTDKYGKTTTRLSNYYCWYDVKYVVRDVNGKFLKSGRFDFTNRSSLTVRLPAKTNQIYKITITVAPRYSYAYNSRTRKYYLAYKWPTPSRWTVKAGKDIVTMYKKSSTKLK